MNKAHGHMYGNFYFDDFKRKLEFVLKKEEKNKIFVASDNNESIGKLQKNFDIIHYNNIRNRSNIENNKG